MVNYIACPARVQAVLESEPFHVTSFPDGRPWTEFYRYPYRFLLRFPDLADFEVALDGSEVFSYPGPHTTTETVKHLYLNQVLPLALSNAGRLVFHSSAVEIEKAAIAFLAEAGRGKSTLAAAFAVSGYRFLTDDSLVIDLVGGKYLVQPSHPSIRLWNDSHEYLLDNSGTQDLPISYSEKARLVADKRLTYCDEPRQLKAAYFLGPGNASEVQIERMSGADCLISWSRHSFLLDIQDERLLRTQFDKLANLTYLVPCYRLDYPRRYEALPQLIEFLANFRGKFL